jgi:hypothetical protein
MGDILNFQQEQFHYYRPYCRPIAVPAGSAVYEALMVFCGWASIPALTDLIEAQAGLPIMFPGENKNTLSKGLKLMAFTKTPGAISG